MQHTPVPNIVFDSLISHFSEAEIKCFLIIIRKTLGWYDHRTGGRKQRDWISLSQFLKYTGLSDASVWKAVASLSDRGYITISDNRGNVLDTPDKRRGRKQLYYSLSSHLIKILR